MYIGYSGVCACECFKCRHLGLRGSFAWCQENGQHMPILVHWQTAHTKIPNTVVHNKRILPEA